MSLSRAALYVRRPPAILVQAIRRTFSSINFRAPGELARFRRIVSSTGRPVSWSGRVRGCRGVGGVGCPPSGRGRGGLRIEFLARPESAAPVYRATPEAPSVLLRMVRLAEDRYAVLCDEILELQGRPAYRAVELRAGKLISRLISGGHPTRSDQLIHYQRVLLDQWERELAQRVRSGYRSEVGRRGLKKWLHLRLAALIRSGSWEKLLQPRANRLFESLSRLEQRVTRRQADDLALRFADLIRGRA